MNWKVLVRFVRFVRFVKLVKLVKLINSAQALRDVAAVLHDSALLAVQNLLAHTYCIGSDLDKLVILDETDGLLKRHL